MNDSEYSKKWKAIHVNNKIENAIIDGTMLGHEDHGIFTCSIYLLFGEGSSHQGFGGYGLDEWSKDLNKRIDIKGYGLEFIRQILETVGVDQWEHLKGKHVRMSHEDKWSSPIDGIGHIMKDKWFYPKEFFNTFDEYRTRKVEDE